MHKHAEGPGLNGWIFYGLSQVQLEVCWTTLSWRNR